MVGEIMAIWGVVILATAVLVGALLLLVGYTASKNRSNITSFASIVLFFGGLFGGLLFLGGANPQIDPDEVGVLYKNDHPVALVDPDVGYINPLRERIENEKIGARTMQNLTITQTQSEKSWKVVGYTNDGGKVSVGYRLDYQVLTTSFIGLHQEFGKDWENEIIKKQLEDLLKQEVLLYSTVQFARDPSLVKAEVFRRLDEHLKKEGVIITDLYVSNQ